MTLAGARVRPGFPRAGSAPLLTHRLPTPAGPHRRDYWAALAQQLGFGELPALTPTSQPARHIVIHTGAAQPTREWPRERFAEIAARLRAGGREVTLLDGGTGGLDEMIATLARADRFIGNDSGPGHVAALLGVPTFTIFGAQLARNFHPAHPQAAWLDGAPCPYKPCHDYCRFPRPHCIQDVSVEAAWEPISRWLAAGA
jgi:heptosyltransferase-2